MTFEVCATTVDGATGCSQFGVEIDIRALVRLNVSRRSTRFSNLFYFSAQSYVSIDGPQKQFVNADQPFTLNATPRPYRTPVGAASGSGLCEPVSLSDIKRITYTWSRVSGPASLDGAGLQYSAQDLTIPAGALEPGATYKLQVAAFFYVDSPTGVRVLAGGSNVQEVVTLVVADNGGVAARIEPGGVRLVPRSAAIVLDATTSLAADGGALAYEWDCYARGDARRKCWIAGSAPQNSAQLALSGNALLPDTYTFVVVVRSSKASGRAETTIIVAADEVPLVTTQSAGAFVDGGVVSGNEPFSLRGAAVSVRGRALVAANWTVVPPIASGIKQSSDGLALTVAAGSLKPGLTYTFRFQADDGFVRLVCLLSSFIIIFVVAFFLLLSLAGVQHHTARSATANVE